MRGPSVGVDPLACFPALEGCDTWGKTYEEAVMHAEEALALYLETFDELGGIYWLRCTSLDLIQRSMSD